MSSSWIPTLEGRDRKKNILLEIECWSGLSHSHHLYRLSCKTNWFYFIFNSCTCGLWMFRARRSDPSQSCGTTGSFNPLRLHRDPSLCSQMLNLLCHSENSLKGRRLGTDTYTCRMPSEDEGRDQDDAATSQRMPKINSKPQASSRGHGTDSPSQPSEGTKPCQHLAFDLLNSRTVKQLSHLVCGTLI